jgi:hypothetical protein
LKYEEVYNININEDKDNLRLFYINSIMSLKNERSYLEELLEKIK